MASEVLLPTSPDEAIAAFGDGAGVTVVGGGTILMPEVTYGRLRPEKRLLLLDRSGLSGVTRGDGVVRIGAATPVSELEAGDEPLASVARTVADPEIRGQATVGGNVCATASPGAPRGDLQAPLLALGARVRSAGPQGKPSEPLEDFLAGDRAGRLLLEIVYDDVERRAGRASVHRPHAHHYSILSVCATRSDGETRVAVAGAGPIAVRATSVEQAVAAGEPAEIAAHKVLDDVDPPDDALASAWYRTRVLPTVVARALAALEKEDA
jgi:CO/xanthine dehydrogenase FAD-binding subunit